MTVKKGIYIQLYNIHGLIRGTNLELGRDSDTGGQTKYVYELANQLSRCDEIEEVEIVTRYINDKEISPDYSMLVEIVNEKLKIIRIGCGGGKYIKKEMLWNHLEEFVDKSIKYIKSKGRLPDIIHSHYADAGYVCTELTKFFGIPLIHTSHSLGVNKRNNLFIQGLSNEEIEKRFKMSKRIEAEESVLFYADQIIASTNHEIDEQYSAYQNFSRNKFVLIPPGINLEKFHPFNEKREWDEESQKIRDGIRDELWKFFTNMYKPIILAISRPDKRKNISGLIKAYGESCELQKKANLAIFAGLRKDISQMPDVEKEALTEILLLMDKYNLYGKMAIPKSHDFEYEVPELYRIAAETRGILVNAAFVENFGLTILEAASSGLPVVATNHGGPRDIITNLENGEMIDVNNTDEISRSILNILNNESLWDRYSLDGINKIKHFYSWEAHTLKYIKIMNELVSKEDYKKILTDTGKRFFNYKKLLVADIDDTLFGDSDSETEIQKLLKSMNQKIGFCVATGRHIDSAKEIFKEKNFILPDIIISAVGSEIYYKSDYEYIYGTGWDAHISYQWKPQLIMKLLKDFPFLKLQELTNQRKFKIAYYVEDDIEKIQLVKNRLIENKIKANVIISHDMFLDILPFRASKGRAVRYLSYRWNIPYESILVAGDSGNDEDMLTGEMLGVVVGNYSSELEKLKGKRKIYFAKNSYAGGIIEGSNYYNFWED
ncbi:MAG: HAD-IIB family hydrolase [bacterium]